MSALRVGLWSVGAHAHKNLIPALEACDETELVVALSRSPVTLAGIDVTDDVDRFLAADIDVVVIAGPPGLHASQALQSLQAGHSVWSEKPVTTSHAEAQALVDRAVAEGLVILETDMFLHHPQWAALREATSRIGRVGSIAARFGFPHLPDGNIRYDLELGGGALNDAGFYPIAAAVDLLGDGIEVRAAVIATEPSFAVDTTGSALLVDETDATAHIEWGFGRSYRNEVEVWGEDGWVRAERIFAKPQDLTTTVVSRRSDGSVDTTDVPPANHFAIMFRQFARITTGDDHGAATAAMLTRAEVADKIRRIAR